MAPMGRPGAWLCVLVLAAGCGEQQSTLANVVSAEMEGRSGTLYASAADGLMPWLRERFNVTVSLASDGTGPCTKPGANVVARANGQDATWRSGGPSRYGCIGWVFGFNDVPPGNGEVPPTVRATIDDGTNTVEIEADLFPGTRAKLANPADGRVPSEGIVTVEFASVKPLEPPGTARLIAQAVNATPERTATVIVGQSAIASVKLVAPPGPNKLYVDAKLPESPVTTCVGVAKCRALPSPALGPLQIEMLERSPFPP